MANEENFEQFPNPNYFEQFKRDCENDRIASDARNIAEKKEKDKLQKAQNKKWDENYNKRKYYDLIWTPKLKQNEGKWDHTSLEINHGDDMYNFSIESPYPEDYDYNIFTCVKITEGVVYLYNEDYFLRTLDTEISAFSSLNKTKSGEVLYRIPSGTYVDIIKTITHKRKIRNSFKSYFYIMCEVKINTELNPKPINEYIYPVLMGYIWHTFMDTSNIAYVSALDLLTKRKPGLNYSLNSIQLDNVKITFEASDDYKLNYNSFAQVRNAKPKLFNALDAAAKESNVIEIHIYALNYKTGSSHPFGTAADITTITTSDNIVHEYFKEYDKSTQKWSNLVQSDAVRDFEKAFMRQSDSERIWGPWFFHDKEMTILNAIDNSRYPELGKVKTEKEYIVFMLASDTVKYEDMKKNQNAEYQNQLKEWKLNYNDKGPDSALMNNIINVVPLEKLKFKIPPEKTNEKDDYKKLRQHWEHRNHGHFAVKLKDME